MKVETADYLAKACVALADAHKIATLPLPRIGRDLVTFLTTALPVQAARGLCDWSRRADHERRSGDGACRRCALH